MPADPPRPAGGPGDYVRSAFRFQPRPDLLCEVESWGVISTARQVLNISEAGVRLLLGLPASPGEVLEVRLYVRGTPVSFAVSADVMYVQRGAAGEYVIGAAFRRPLSPRLLAMLA